MQVDGLAYSLTAINKVIFGKPCVDMRGKISLAFRKNGRSSTHDVKVNITNDILEVTYPSVRMQRSRDSIKIGDFNISAIHCKFTGTNNSIVLQNDNIYFCNHEISTIFNNKSSYNERIENFDMGDIFALNTIFHGSLDVELISTLIDQYKQMRKYGTEMILTIERHL